MQNLLLFLINATKKDQIISKMHDGKKYSIRVIIVMVSENKNSRLNMKGLK